MLKIHTKHQVRLITIEKPTAWVVYAVLVEITSSKTTTIGVPRLVRVIPKETVAPALTGTISTPQEAQERAHSKIFTLAAPFAALAEATASIPSPYISELSKENLDFILWFSARPPTLSY